MTSFPNQQPDEKILIFLRRHWIALFKVIMTFILLVVLVILLDIGSYYFTNVWKSQVGYPLMVLANSAYFLFVMLFSFANFVDYYLDVWIVTNKRIVNIEQKGLFARVVSEKELSRMQDVTSEVKGFVQTFLHYGDVFIQTAGEKERFIFKQVPNAAEMAQKISNLVSKTRETKPLPVYEADQETSRKEVEKEINGQGEDSEE